MFAIQYAPNGRVIGLHAAGCKCPHEDDASFQECTLAYLVETAVSVVGHNQAETKNLIGACLEPQGVVAKGTDSDSGLFAESAAAERQEKLLAALKEGQTITDDDLAFLEGRGCLSPVMESEGGTLDTDADTRVVVEIDTADDPAVGTEVTPVELAAKSQARFNELLARARGEERLTEDENDELNDLIRAGYREEEPGV